MLTAYVDLILNYFFILCYLESGSYITCSYLLGTYFFFDHFGYCAVLLGLLLLLL